MKRQEQRNGKRKLVRVVRWTTPGWAVKVRVAARGDYDRARIAAMEDES